MARYIRRGMRPERFHGLAALVLTGILTAWIYLKLGMPRTWPALLASWILAISIVAFGYYGYDKWRARVGSRRVPEAILHGLTLFGGSLGAYLGMRCFRHKTIKGSFQTVFWTAISFQVAVICFIAYLLWRTTHA